MCGRPGACYLDLPGDMVQSTTPENIIRWVEKDYIHYDLFSPCIPTTYTLSHLENDCDVTSVEDACRARDLFVCSVHSKRNPRFPHNGCVYAWACLLATSWSLSR